MAELRFALGQRAKGRGNRSDRRILVEIADQPDFDRAVFQPVADRCLEVIEGQLFEHRLVGERKARVVVRQDRADLAADGSFAASR